MGALLRIDQAGLPLGVPGVARDDGLAGGQLVTLTNLGGGSTTKINLLWVPPDDITALVSLIQTGPNVWTFSPTAGAYGRYRIQLIVDDGLPTKSETIHNLGIALPGTGIVIPAANELADPSTTRQNDTEAARLEASESNAPFGPFAGRSPYGWWPWVDQVSRAAAGIGGGAVGIRHHLLPGVNIVVEPTFEYLVQGPFTIEAGASITLNGADARLSVI